MKQVKSSWGIALVVVISFLLSSLFGPWFVERLAQNNWAKKYNILNTRTPLVINTREEVRISETQDLVAIGGKSKERVAALVRAETASSSQLLASLVAVSSDGWYIAPKQVLVGVPLEQLRVLSESGRGVVSRLVVDPDTDLSFIKSDLAPRSVMPIAISSDLVPGSRTAFVGLLDLGQLYLLSGVVSSPEFVSSGSWVAGQPTRKVLLQVPEGSVPGQAVVNNNADLAGVWSGNQMIPASVVQESVNKLLSAEGFARASFGFSVNLSSGFGQPRVMTVSDVQPKSPATVAGLKVGDKILEVDGKRVEGESLPDKLFSQLIPGKTYNIKIVREEKELVLSILPVAKKGQ